MASITNRGTDPLDFGCTVMDGCTNYSARGVAAGPGEGLSALNFEFGGSALYSRVLAPGETFGFIFGTIRFDPLDPLGNPYGTALHPRFSVVFDQFQTHAETTGLTISIGALSFAPPTYFASHPTSDPVPAPVPEPSTLLLLASGLAGLGGMAWRRRRRGWQRQR